MNKKDENLNIVINLKEDLSNSYKKSLINEWISNSLYRDILIRKLCYDDTYDKIAEDFDRTPTRVRSIVIEGINQLKEHAVNSLYSATILIPNDRTKE